MINQPDHGRDDDFDRISDEGLCLLDGEIIVNPREVVMIRRLGGKTLVYRSGVSSPDILPAAAFAEMREMLFLPDDDNDDDDEIDDSFADEVEGYDSEE